MAVSGSQRTPDLSDPVKRSFYKNKMKELSFQKRRLLFYSFDLTALVAEKPEKMVKYAEVAESVIKMEKELLKCFQS